ncbi:NAD(P)/FAD-dependent oxidoreductase [Nakamurella sp.]|uniref:NAD(P)/FAD-dependent oxidoreductase n=1 Tax=Nakamurella sp. TaxID=1869182 RepID=UPI0037841F9E
MTPRRIVLLGGGYVSLFAYRALRPAIRSGSVQVTVLSADSHHNFHGFTGEVVAGLLPYRLTRAPLATLMPLADVVHGTVRRVDRPAQTAVVAPADGTPDQLVGYDQLVVGTGGREPLAAIPGLATYGYSLRAPGEFHRFLRRLDDLVRTGGNEPVVIVGGGSAGVELAAAVAGRFRRGRAEMPVMLVHSGAGLLPGSPPRMGAATRRELARLGVLVRLNVRVRRVGESAVELSDGSRVAAAAVLATHGQRPVGIPGLADLVHDERGRLVVDPTFRVADTIWAAGDAARVAHPVTGRPVPANALWAIKAGSHLGRNLRRVIGGRNAGRFRYRGLGQAMAFGVGRSAAELYGVPLSGWAGWLLRLAFFLRFMPLRRQALGVLAALARPAVVRNTASRSAGRRQDLPGDVPTVRLPVTADSWVPAT